MTFAARPSVSTAGPVGAWGVTLSDVQTTPTSATGTVQLNTSGTITGTNESGDTAWYLPTGGTPGNSYWVKFTKNSGDAWNAGLTAGTVYALSSARALTWSVSGGLKSANVTASIYSDSGGTNLVGTGTIIVNIESS